MLNKLNTIIETTNFVDEYDYYKITEDLKVNELGFVVRKCRKALFMDDCEIAMMCVVPEEDSYVPMIVVDDYFRFLTPNTKQFTLLHELGHYNKQLDILVNGTDEYRNIELEFEADEYAMSILGKEKSIAALKEIEYMINEMGCGSVCKEIASRIENLESK